jgi:hypothetical protein
MFIDEPKDCLDTLIDLLCYEMSCGRLSPEMEALLALHLERCTACKRRVSNFLELIEDASSSRVPSSVN